MSITRYCHKHTLQINPRHRKEETEHYQSHAMIVKKYIFKKNQLYASRRDANKEENILSRLSRVTVTSCFVNKIVRDLELIDHLFINPILRIGLIHK